MTDTDTLPDLREITFADNLLPNLLDGEKTATVRYNAYRTVTAGDTLIACTTDHDPVALIDITYTASLPAKSIHNFMELVNAKYSSTNPTDAIKTLNTHYDTTITPNTTVHVLVFTVTERL